MRNDLANLFKLKKTLNIKDTLNQKSKKVFWLYIKALSLNLINFDVV